MYSRFVKSACVVLASACVAFMPMGCKKAPPITLACNATPPAIFPGEPVTVTATPGAVSTKKKISVIYNWSGDGVTGNGPTATVNTAALPTGTSTVKVGVKEGKLGKEGLKPGQSAECTTTFAVKEFEPPTISCSASPTTIKPGDSSAITAVGMSPQNRPLTYTYSAAAGTVQGSGTTATFASAGAPTGSVAITCKVADDKTHTASAETSVTIVAPPPPPIPHASALCSLSFDRDPKRPTRVDNEAKACLDEVALGLQKQSDAKAVIIGESTAAEKLPPKHHRKNAKVLDIAAQRAVNAKDYLVKEKGIDPSRISVVTSAQDGQKIEDYLVPAGATFTSDVQGTTPVDESGVTPQERKPLPERHHK
ncbi:MAG: OmpA family protein [Terracidiphilus sp.]|nr:OmpA family protein [Terracidiphilus sp.]